MNAAAEVEKKRYRITDTDHSFGPAVTRIRVLKAAFFRFPTIAGSITFTAYSGKMLDEFLGGGLGVLQVYNVGGVCFGLLAFVSFDWTLSQTVLDF